MNQSDIKKFSSWLGKRSYMARLERLGLERLHEQPALGYHFKIGH